MSPGPLRSLRLTTGLLLAILALISQIALGAVVLPGSASAEEQSVAALSILCNTGTPAAPGDNPGHHHAPDCTLCPLCITLAAPSAILTDVAVLPAPSSILIGRTALLPPARGPPSQTRIVPPARGPPILT